MNDIILWSDARFCSPWVLTVWVALKEKGIPFTVQELDLAAGQHRKGDYPRMTVTGKVPALTHGETWISESLAILEYLEEAFPEPALLPKDAAARAHDRMVLAHLRSDFGEMRRCMPFEGVFLDRPGPALTSEGRSQAKRLLDLVEWRLSTRGKAPPTLADFELACTLRRFVHHRFPLPARARAFSNAIWKRASVKSWVELDRSRFRVARPSARPARAASRTARRGARRRVR